LAWLGPRAGSSLPAIRACLHDFDPEVFVSAMRALIAVLGHRTPADDLLRAMQHGPPELRWTAALALGEDSSGALEAAAEVVSLAASEEREVRRLALAGLRSLGRATRAAEPALLALLEAGPPAISRVEVVQTLGTIGPVILHKLVQDLSVDDPPRQVEAAQLLGLIGPRARAALPELVAYARSCPGVEELVLQATRRLATWEAAWIEGVALRFREWVSRWARPLRVRRARELFSSDRFVRSASQEDVPGLLEEIARDDLLGGELVLVLRLAAESSWPHVRIKSLFWLWRRGLCEDDTLALEAARVFRSPGHERATGVSDSGWQACRVVDEVSRGLLRAPGSHARRGAGRLGAPATQPPHADCRPHPTGSDTLDCTASAPCRLLKACNSGG